jgi:hypothetical protein
MEKSSNRSDAQQWHDPAREARANAARIKDPEGSRLMLEITATCEQLAQKAKEGEQRE